MKHYKGTFHFYIHSLSVIEKVLKIGWGVQWDFGVILRKETVICHIYIMLHTCTKQIG